MAQFSVLTSYHFNRESAEKYERLLRNIRASFDEVRGRGRIILVANGTAKTAAHPDEVLRDLCSQVRTVVVPVDLACNTLATGGLNASAVRALEIGGATEDHYLVSVQSSAVLTCGWLDEAKAALGNDPRIIGSFGRLVLESNQNVIWADGHQIRQRRGHNINFGKSLIASTTIDVPGVHAFPCLSAALYRASAVKQTVDKYGAMVSEALAHYGDCPDVALRLHSVTGGRFGYSPNAIAIKREPEFRQVEYQASQILASKRYYSTPGNPYLNPQVSVQQRVNELLRCSYTQSGLRALSVAPPHAACFDPEV